MARRTDTHRRTEGLRRMVAVATTAPYGFVLEGVTHVFRYSDRLDFAGDGTGTRMTYSARLEFKGPFVIGEPALQLLFNAIGDDATRDIPVAVVEGSVRAA